MLVMSLSPLLGQAIPDIAETTEIVVFPRRGARSGCSRVLKPHGKKQSRYPPRIPWRLLGGALGRPGGLERLSRASRVAPSRSTEVL